MEGVCTLSKQIEEKLEKLKEQYDQQLRGIRSQLDDINGPRNDDEDGPAGEGSRDPHQIYQQAKEELGKSLPGDQKDQLDSLVSDIDKGYQQQMAAMQRHHVDDVDNQVHEIRNTLEEIYNSQLQVVRSELEQSHQVALLEQRETLDKDHKEEINKLHQELETLQAYIEEEERRTTLENVISKEDDSDVTSAAFISKLNEKLVVEHKEILKKIDEGYSREHREANTDSVTSAPTTSKEYTEVREKHSVLAKAGDVQKSLEQQCEEIATLRAQMLGEYEQLLTVRAEVMSSQSQEVEKLQQEMASIQQQYERQIQEFETKVQAQTETSLRTDLESSHAKELEKMKQYYEEKVSTMEQSYTSDINKLKQEHEELLARLQEETSSPGSPHRSPDSQSASALAKQRQYVRKTMTLTAISDEEETPPSSPTGNEVLEGRIQALEIRLKDREKVVDELKKRLEAETTSAEDLHGKLLDSNKTLYEYEEGLKQKIEEIYSLRAQLKTKDKTITDLESEKAALEEKGEKGKDVSGVSDSKVIKELKERIKNLEDELSASKVTNKRIQAELNQLDAQHGEAIMKLKVEMENLTTLRLEEAEAGFKIQLEEELNQQAEEIENRFKDKISNQSQELEIYKRTEKELRGKLENVNEEHEKQLLELNEKLASGKSEKQAGDSVESTVIVSEINETQSSSPTYSAEVDRDSLEAAIRENVRAEILEEYEESVDKLKSEYESKISELNIRIQSFETQAVQVQVTETEKDTETESILKESVRAELAQEYKEKLQNVTGEYEDKLKHLQDIVDGRKEVQSPITRSKSVDSETVMKGKDVKIPKEYEGFVATIKNEYEDKISSLQTEIAQYRSTLGTVPSPVSPQTTQTVQLEFAQGDTADTSKTEKVVLDAGLKMPARPSDMSSEKQDMYDEMATEFEKSFRNLRESYENQIKELKAKITVLESEKDEIENKVCEELTTKYEFEIKSLKVEYEEKVTKLEEDVKKAVKDKSAAEQKVKADMFVWHEETVNQLKRKHEEMISQLSKEYEEKMDLTREELQEEFDVEKSKIEQKHRQEIVDLEDRYENLVEGVRTGGAPEVAEIVQEKFDMELEMAKTLIQQECDETIESETSRLSEQFEDQLKEAISNKDEELAEQKAKYEKELDDLRTTLLQQYESQVIEMQSQHQAEIQKAQIEFGTIVEKVKSDSVQSSTASFKVQKSVDSKTSEESEIEEEIEKPTTSTSSFSESDKSDKDDGDDKGSGGAAAQSQQTDEGTDTQQEPQKQDTPDSGDHTQEKSDALESKEKEVEVTKDESTAQLEGESELVQQLRQELAQKIAEYETIIAQLKVVHEEELAQIEQILNEKEEDYQKRITAMEHEHEQQILEYQNTLAKLKQGMPDADSSEAMELAHQQELQDLENRLVQKHKNDLDNLEKQHQSKLTEMQETHKAEVSKLQLEVLEAQRVMDQYPDTITTVQAVPTFTVASSLGSSKGSSDFMAPSRDSVSEVEEQEVEEQVIEAVHLTKSQSLQGTGSMETQVFEARTSSEEKSPDGSPQGTLDEFGIHSLDTSVERSRGTLRGVDDTQDSELIHFSEEDSDKSVEEVDTTQKSDRSTPTALMQTLGYGADLPGGPTVKSLDDTTDSSVRASDREEAVSRIKELETEVQDLKQRLEFELTKQEDQMDRLDREKQEESNLVAMLRGDIERLNTDREALQNTNEHLLGLLSDSVKTYMNTEETISKKLKAMMDKSVDRSGDKGHAASGDRKKTTPPKRSPVASPGRLSPARADDSDNLQETSILSNVTDEGLDLSQRISDSIFQGPDLAEEEEELMADSGNRLRNSVTHLLEMIEETTNQLLDTRQTQSELMDTLESRGLELEQTTARCADLEERLRDEVERKDYLALELHKAEGLIEGYSSEREMLDQKIQDLEEQKETLVLELETTKNKLLDMTSVQGENLDLKKEMADQKDLMANNVGEEAQATRACETTVEPSSGDQALMLEVTRLNSENREKEQQIKQTHDRYESRIRDLETSGEDMESHFTKLLDEKKQEVADLRLQVDALEKQLKAKKQFLEEQTSERDQEHEDYQKELENWKKMVHDLEKQNGSGSRLQKEVDDLTDQLQTRVDLHSQALLTVDKAQEELRDKELSLKELNNIIQQLETEIQDKTKESQQDKQKIQKLETLLQSPFAEEDIEAEKTELVHGKKASTLEFDMSEAERRERLAAQLSVEEELRQAAEKTKEELVREKHALQTQLNECLVQLSALRNQLDEMRHRKAGQDEADSSKRREEEREKSEEKEKEISELKLTIEQLTEQVENRSQQIEQLRATGRSPVEREEYETDREIELQMEAIKRENKQLRERVQLSQASSITDISGLSQNLLEEKNQEIDHLSEQVLRLQTEFTELKTERGVENLYEEIESLKAELKQKEVELEGGQSVRVSAAFTDHSLTPDSSLMNVGASFADKTSIQQEMEESEANRLDRMASLESEITTLQTVLNNKEEEILILQKQVKQLTEGLEQAEAITGGEDVGMLQDIIQEKEELIVQMTAQVDSLQTEVDNLSDFQNKLQEDFDTVQNMLEEKDREIESLHKELTDRSPESTDEHALVIKHEVEIARLKKDLREKDNVIEEKLEEMAEMTDKLEVLEAMNPKVTIQQQNEEIEKLKNTVEQLLGRPPSPPQSDEEKAVFEKQKHEIEALKVELETVKLGRPPSPPGEEKADIIQRLKAEIDRLKQQIMDNNLPEDDKSVLIRELRLQNETLSKQVDAALKIRPPSPPMDDDEKSAIIYEQKKEIAQLKSQTEETRGEAMLKVRSEDGDSELIRKQEKEIVKLKKQVEAALQIAPPPPPMSEGEKDRIIERQEKDLAILKAEMVKVTSAFASEGSLSSVEDVLKEKQKLDDDLRTAETTNKSLQEELKSAKEVRAYEDEIELKEKEDEIEELQAELERYRSGTESTLAHSVDLELSNGENETTDSKQLVRSMSFYKEQYEEKCSENRQLQVSLDLLKQQLEKAKVEQIEDLETRSEIEMFKEEIERKYTEEIKELKERRNSLEKEVTELKLDLSKFDQDPDVRLMSLEKELQLAKEEAANERMDTVQAINDLEKLRERKEKERRDSVKSIQELESKLDEKDDKEKELNIKIKQLTEELETVKKSKLSEFKRIDSQEAFELGTDIGTLQQQVLQYKQQADKTKEILAEKQKYQSQVVKLEIQYENLQKQLSKDIGTLEEQLKASKSQPEQEVWDQLRATQERLEKTTQKLEETSHRLTEADSNLNRISADLRNREDDMKELQQDLWKTSGQLSVTSGKLQETEEKLRLTIAQVTEREEQIHQLQGELQHAQQETEQVQQSSASKPEEVEKLKRQLKTNQSELEQVKKSLKEAVEMSEQQLQMVENKDQEYIKLKLEIQQTISNKDKIIREQKHKLKESEQEVNKTKQEAARVKQETSKVKQEAEKKEKQVTKLTEDVSRLEEQNQEEMIAELRKNDEFKKEETEALLNTIAELRKQEEGRVDEKEQIQNRIDNQQREIEELRSLVRSYEERSRSDIRGPSPLDQNGRAPNGQVQPREDEVYLESQFYGSQKKPRVQKGQGDHTYQQMGYVSDQDDSGHQSLQEQASRGRELDIIAEGHRSTPGQSHLSKSDLGSVAFNTDFSRQIEIADEELETQSSHRKSPQSRSPRSQGGGSPQSSKGRRSPSEYDSNGRPVVDETMSMARTESSESVPRFDMSTSPPVREPRRKQDISSQSSEGGSRTTSRADGHRSPQSDRPQPQIAEGGSYQEGSRGSPHESRTISIHDDYRSPSRSDGHRSPPHHRDSPRSNGDRSPPSDGRSPPSDERSSSHGGKSPPHDDRSPPHGYRSPPQSGRSSSHGGRSPPHSERSSSNGGRSPPHDGRISSQHSERSLHDETRSPSRSDGHRSPHGRTSPIHDEGYHTVDASSVARAQHVELQVSRGEGHSRDTEVERYIGEDGQLYDRDDNLRPRYHHTVDDQYLESQPRDDKESGSRSGQRSRSDVDQGEGHDTHEEHLSETLPTDAERYIQQLRRELLITKTALMQIQKGGSLDREAGEQSIAQDVSQAQNAMQQEVRPGHVSFSPQLSRNISERRYETLPEEDDINRLQRELERAEEELELYRTSSNLSARDFVQKVMNLKDELSGEHQRHIHELQTRTKQESEAQLETLRIKYTDEIEHLKRLHLKELEQRLNDLQLKLERKFKADMNKEKVRHQEEVTLLKSRAGLDLDDGSPLGARQGGVGQDRNGASMVNGHSESEAMSSKLQEILRRLHSEGVQVLNISELELLHRSRSQTDLREADLESLKTGWENERQSMISTIQSLKDLLAQTHKLKGLDKDDDNDDDYLSTEGSDWRAELLRAIGYVFTKERESQLAELRSHALSHPSASIDEIQRLEQKIRNMESHHHSSMDQIYGADRQSLLAEIRDLRAHATITRLHHQEERERMNEQLSNTDDQAIKKERQLKRQDSDDEDSSSEYEELPKEPEPVDFISAGVQLLEFKIQQEKVLQEDLRTSLDAERYRTSDLSHQLTKEKDSSMGLQSSVSGLQVQVAKLKESLEREQSRYVSVTSALEEEKAKSLNLSELLEAENTKVWQTQQELDELRRQQEAVDPQRIQHLEAELAAEREVRLQLESSQEINQVTIDNLKQEVEMGKRHLQEVDKALENERHLTARFQQNLEAEKLSNAQISDRERAYILDLQNKLDSEQAKVQELNLHLQKEQDSKEDVSMSSESEKNMLRDHLNKERALNQELKHEMEKLQFDRLEAVNKLQKERDSVQRLKSETDQLTEDLRRLRSQEMQRDHDREVEKLADKKLIREADRQKEELRMKLHEQQLETQRLTQKAKNVEDQLASSRENELKVIRELEQEKLHVLESQECRADMVSAQTSPRKEDGFDDQQERRRVYRSQLESMCQSLHYLLLRCREQMNKASHGSRQQSEYEDFDALQRSLHDLRQELKQLQELEGDFMSHPSSSVNERILRQNEELTNFVARISEEKTELRNTMTQLEEEIWRYRQMDSQLQDMQRATDSTDQLLTKERSKWSKEKLNLQMALNSAEHEIDLLQADLRVERERRVATGVTETRDADKMKIQRLYGKFLRAESFRKALIYQKKYLLLLLGGFRDTEETTLSLLSRMGAVDTYSHHYHKKRPITSFRGAARVVIAICRMQYLVRKWKRATRVGSEVVGGTVDENEGYVPQTSAYSPPSPPRYTTSARVISAPVRSTTPTLRSSPRRHTSPQRSSDSMLFLSRRDPPDTDSYSSSSYHSPRAAALTSVMFTPPTKDYSYANFASTSSGARRKLLTSVRIPVQAGSVRLSESPSRNGVAGDAQDYAHRLENLQNRLGKLQTDRRYVRKEPWR